MSTLLQHLGKCWRFFLALLLLQALLFRMTAASAENKQAGKNVKEVYTTLEFNNEDVISAFKKIEEATGFSFSYNISDVKEKKINGNYQKQSLFEILIDFSRQSNLKFRQYNDVINVKPKLKGEKAKDVEIAKVALTVQGVVSDQGSGQPLPGVNVIIKGSSTGTVTDVEGAYSLNVPNDSDTLLFSSIGYISREIGVNGRSTINVVLEEDVRSLEEVVVVGYGTEKKVNVTGSVSSIDGSELEEIPVGQTTMALQGVAPGVTVTQRSGQPGSDGGNIRIRGVGTLGDSNPLVMVDGVETDLSNVDPNAIENISILKDAASAAIYGARAANGVILVTTKRGKEGVSVNYNGYVGLQTPTDMPNIVNGADHMELMSEAYTNVGLTPIWTPEQIETHRNEMPSDQYPDTDWQELTMKNSALMQNHNLNINAGNERAKLFASLSYLDQDGIIPNTDFNRFNIRLNSDINITDKLTTSMDVFLRRTVQNQPSNGTGYVFHWMRRIPSNEVGLLSNGLYGEGWNGDHPLARAKDGGIWTIENLDAILNFRANYQFTDWLSAEVMYAPRFENPHEVRFYNITQTYARDGVTPTHFVPQRNSLTERFDREWYNNLRAIVTVDKSFNDMHQLSFLAGYQQEDQTSNWVSAYREVFPLPEYQEIDAGNRANELTRGSGTHWALQSLFGRLKYNFRDRYLLEANVRRDGSSRFAEGNRHGVFPSFSAAWRISEEPFMQGVSDVVDHLKLRASWGQLGNQNIGLYPYAAFIQIGGGNTDYVFNNAISPGAALTNMANPDIVWETSETTDIGIEANLWGKLDITFDYYYRLTNDILLQLNIPQTLGLEAPFQNAGVVENRGWDFVTTYRDRVGELNYSITFNLSDVKNEVLDMKGIQQSGLQVDREGYPIGSFFGYRALGLFQSEDEVEDHATQFGTIAPGDIKYQDINNDGIINDQDQVVIGSPIPRYTYGARFNLDYKAFDFSLFLQGVGKADGYLFGQGIMPFYLGGTVQEQHKDRWTPDNTDASYPRLAFNQVNNEQNSSFWMKDASYLRLQNIQIGYTIPQGVINNVQRLRIYLSGRNLFTIDNFYEGYDPEAPVSNGGWYPQMKVFTAGLNLSF
ncbi:TonB-dependent receptor [Catalinimonas sp. 4WD22]|uniref:SusC/RagA family TonB-linked outer membrane protein n=1 Tax=Catalinimonas locisalis TaxID=3133978 RepID=UPI0031013AC9